MLTVKRISLFLLLILITLPLISTTAVAQDDTSENDAIKETVLNYIEGWYEGDVERMDAALHPDLVKRIVFTDPRSSRSMYNEASKTHMLEYTRAGLGKKYAKDRFLKRLVRELQQLWDNKTRHGANRQKFGPYQEKLLGKLVRTLVPARERPSKKAPLRLDTKFRTYCKAIIWNAQKSMGKKITREKVIRTGQVSLSEFDYLGVK